MTRLRILLCSCLVVTTLGASPSTAEDASRHWLLSVSDVAVSEESCDPHQAVFAVRLFKRVYNLPPEVVTVQYATADGSAVAGVDYQATSGTLTFTPPNQLLTVAVPITDALVPGPDKTFTLDLSDPTGAVLSKPIGTATLHAPSVAKCASCALSCDDGDVCTTDVCDATAGCRHPNASATATPYCQLAGVGQPPDPDFDLCNASGEWIDSDGDGFSDAAEIQGYLDLNGNGVNDGPDVDLELPGADPQRPDIYLRYDYMVASDHSHQPPAKAWFQMQSMFAAHGIALHVLAPAAGIPEHQVTTLDPNATPDCAGDDFVTTQQLRAENFGNLRPAYHYMVFAHDSTTPNDGSLAAACPHDPLCGVGPTGGASGVADVPGDDAVVSFGLSANNGWPVPIEAWADAMMHELGHNFGLVHGSLADADNLHQCMNYKPNYISVMNYSYEGGLVPAAGPGEITPIPCANDADCGPPALSTGRCSTPSSCFCTDDLGDGNNVCYRPDYAEDQLLNLNETTLDEHVGVGGPPSLDDIVWYTSCASLQCDGVTTYPGPSNGSPIDWNKDGAIADLTGCVGIECPDINRNLSHNDQLDTTPDWTEENGQFIHLNFAFQCSSGYQNDQPDAATLAPYVNEVGLERAGLDHRLRRGRTAADDRR
jgi:hypothetical protein